MVKGRKDHLKSTRSFKEAIETASSRARQPRHSHTNARRNHAASLIAAVERSGWLNVALAPKIHVEREVFT